MTEDIDLLRAMMLVREFEVALMARDDHGFQLLSSGQEAVSVGLCSVLGEADQLLCSGRSIAPALARGLDPGEVMAELLGRQGGPNQGRAGRGHIAQPARGFFGAHAVVGGNLTIAAGAALAASMKRASRVVACVFGDGACGSGMLHETMNLAALWKLPLLLVCDNNQYSVSTRRDQALAPARLADLAMPFAIPAATVDGMDVRAVRAAAAAFVQHVREGRGPAFLECVSERFHSHSTASRETRTAPEVAAARERCPIEALKRTLLAQGHVDAAALDSVRRDVLDTVARAVAFADASPFPSAQEATAHVDR